MALELSKLPPVTTTFALLQYLIYMSQESLWNVVKEDDVRVSWSKVMEDGEWLRLLYAQYFHFNRVIIFINCITLVAVGNSLERKVKWWSLALLILTYGILTNCLYIGLTRVLCINYVSHQFTNGFTWVVFGLRVVDILVADPRRHWKPPNNGLHNYLEDGEETWVWGFYPVVLPSWLNPWWPLVETVFFDHVILERCIFGNISAILVALTIPFLNFWGIEKRRSIHINPKPDHHD